MNRELSRNEVLREASEQRTLKNREFSRNEVLREANEQRTLKLGVEGS